MKKLNEKVMAFVRDEEGAEMIEYAVTVGLLAAGVVAVFVTLGGRIKNIFTAVDGAIAKAPNGA